MNRSSVSSRYSTSLCAGAGEPGNTGAQGATGATAADDDVVDAEIVDEDTDRR